MFGERFFPECSQSCSVKVNSVCSSSPLEYDPTMAPLSARSPLQGITVACVSVVPTEQEGVCLYFLLDRQEEQGRTTNRKEGNSKKSMNERKIDMQLGAPEYMMQDSLSLSLYIYIYIWYIRKKEQKKINKFQVNKVFVFFS